jgi:type I restriction enzyme M protein
VAGRSPLVVTTLNRRIELNSPNCESLINRDKASLDIFCLRDESLEVSDNFPDPDVLAQEIVDDLEAALEQFREIATDLRGQEAEPEKG